MPLTLVTFLIFLFLIFFYFFDSDRNDPSEVEGAIQQFGLMYCHTEGLFVASVGALSLANPGELSIICFGSESHHHFKIKESLWGQFCDENCSNVGVHSCQSGFSKNLPTASFALVITAHSMPENAVGRDSKNNQDQLVEPSDGAWNDANELVRYKNVAFFLYQDIMTRLEEKGNVWEITAAMKNLLQNYITMFLDNDGDRYATENERIERLNLKNGLDMSTFFFIFIFVFVFCFLFFFYSFYSHSFYSYSFD